MKTPWTKEMGTGPYPEQFAQLNADTYIQRRNIEDAPEMEGVEDPGWVCESRMISSDVYEALQEEYNTPTYAALLEQQEALDDANAMIMLSQAKIEDTQAEQDDTLGLILLNTEKEEV